MVSQRVPAGVEPQLPTAVSLSCFSLFPPLSIKWNYAELS